MDNTDERTLLPDHHNSPPPYTSVTDDGTRRTDNPPVESNDQLRRALATHLSAALTLLVNNVGDSSSSSSSRDSIGIAASMGRVHNASPEPDLASLALAAQLLASLATPGPPASASAQSATFTSSLGAQISTDDNSTADGRVLSPQEAMLLQTPPPSAGFSYGYEDENSALRSAKSGPPSYPPTGQLRRGKPATPGLYLTATLPPAVTQVRAPFAYNDASDADTETGVKVSFFEVLVGELHSAAAADVLARWPYKKVVLAFFLKGTPPGGEPARIKADCRCSPFSLTIGAREGPITVSMGSTLGTEACDLSLPRDFDGFLTVDRSVQLNEEVLEHTSVVAETAKWVRYRLTRPGGAKSVESRRQMLDEAKVDSAGHGGKVQYYDARHLERERAFVFEREVVPHSKPPASPAPPAPPPKPPAKGHAQRARFSFGKRAGAERRQSESDCTAM